MAGVLIGIIIILFLIFFVLTRKSRVRIIKNDEWIIEIHLPILALVLVNRRERDGMEIKEEKKRLPLKSYQFILKRVLKFLEKGEITINKISLPEPQGDFNSKTMTRPYKYGSLVYGLIAYLESKVQRLTVNDNAILLSPDTPLGFDITLTAELYKIINAALFIIYKIKREKKVKNVRE